MIDNINNINNICKLRDTSGARVLYSTYNRVFAIYQILLG